MVWNGNKGVQMNSAINFVVSQRPNSLPSWVDLCSVKEVDPVFIGYSHQLLCYLQNTHTHARTHTHTIPIKLSAALNHQWRELRILFTWLTAMWSTFITFMPLALNRIQGWVDLFLLLLFFFFTYCVKPRISLPLLFILTVQLG